MGKKLKLLALDAIIVLVNIFVFNGFINAGFTLGRIILAVLCVFLSLVAHFGAYILVDVLEEKRIAAKNRALFKTDDEQFEEYMTQLRDLQLKNPAFNGVVNRFTNQVKAFESKEKSLLRIIELNNGAASSFLISRNDEVQKFLLKNVKKLVKRLIVYNAKSANNRAATVEDDSHVMTILNNNDELMDLYDKLLDEVAMMGDDFNIDDPALQSVIESLKELRVGEDDDDDDGEIALHVAGNS